MLAHTHWSETSGTEDRPENYQEVTWTLEEERGRTTLTITERNLPSEEAKRVSEDSWRIVLANLKDLLER